MALYERKLPLPWNYADALSVVVSEETGSISVARNGRILRIDSGRLRTLLSDFYRP